MMDAERFDTLARSLTSGGSRRHALAGLVVSALGLLGTRAEESAAHELKDKCKKKSGAAKKKCLKKAKKHAAEHASETPPTAGGGGGGGGGGCGDFTECGGNRPCINGRCVGFEPCDSGEDCAGLAPPGIKPLVCNGANDKAPANVCILDAFSYGRQCEENADCESFSPPNPYVCITNACVQACPGGQADCDDNSSGFVCVEGLCLLD